jgi:hypothetical protein
MSIFQQSLQDMQRQAQEMERLKFENLEKMLADEQKNLMFLVQKVAGVVKSEYDHFNNMAALSREATEDIISIAFAPPGKATLDPVEKQRVVEKFLGTPQAPSPVPTTGSSVGINNGMELSDTFDSRRESAASHASAVAAAAVRPATPPGSPQPVAANSRKPSIAQNLIAAATAASVSNGGAGAGGPATIQESLKRLNLAASQIQRHNSESSASGNGADSPATDEPRSASNAAAAAVDSPTATTSVRSISSAGGLTQQQQDLIIAIHDFGARSDRELSFKKNDILIVKQRQENWLYACHKTPPANGVPVKSGWVPFSYIAEYHP